MAEEIAAEYKTSLEDLTVNSKPIINMLTMVAEENIGHAAAICQVIEERIYKAPPNKRLPLLYLIDSILKNIKKKEYVEVFSNNLKQLFATVFEKVDEKTRQALYKLRQTWSDIFANKMLYALDARIAQIDPAWPITAKQDPVSIHINPKFLNPQKSPSPDVATEKQREDQERRQQGKEAVLRQARERRCLLEEERAKHEQAEESQVRDQLLAKQQELIKLQQERLELELSDARTRLEQQSKQLQLREELMRQQLLVQLQQNARSETTAKKPVETTVVTKTIAPVSSRDPRTKRDPPVSQPQEPSKLAPTSIDQGKDSVVKPPPTAEPRSIMEKQKSASASVKEPSSPGKSSATKRASEKVGSPTKDAANSDPQKTARERLTLDKSKVQTEYTRSTKKEANHESGKRSKEQNDKDRDNARQTSRNEKDSKLSDTRRTTRSTQNRIEKKDTKDKVVTRSNKEKRDSLERDRIAKLDRSKRNYRSHLQSESPESEPPKDHKHTRGRARSLSKSPNRSRSPLAHSAQTNKSSTHNNRRSSSTERRQRDNSETCSRERHKREGEIDRRTSAGRKGRRSSTPQNDRGTSPPKKKVKQEIANEEETRDENVDTKGGLSDDLAELFGTEDQDLRRLPPIPKLSTNLQIPEEVSFPGGLMSPSSAGWSKFKASHPEEFPFSQPRTNELLHRQASNRSPLKSPPAGRYLDQPFGSSNILEQAEQQLRTGKLTPSQHKDLLEQLMEYQELQKMKKDLREKSQRINQASTGAQRSVPGQSNVNLNGPSTGIKQESTLGTDGPGPRQTLLPDPGRQPLLPDPTRQALLPDPVRKPLLPDPMNATQDSSANVLFRHDVYVEQAPTSAHTVLNRNVPSTSMPRFPMDPRLRSDQDRQSGSEPKQPSPFDSRREFGQGPQSFPYETPFIEGAHAPGEPVHDLSGDRQPEFMPPGPMVHPEPGALGPLKPPSPQGAPLGPPLGPPGPSHGPLLGPNQGPCLGPLHRPPLEAHGFGGPQPGGPADMRHEAMPGPLPPGPMPVHRPQFPGLPGPVHPVPGPQPRMPLEPNASDVQGLDGNPSQLMGPGHGFQGASFEPAETPWYDTDVFYCAEHDARWVSRVKTKPQNDRSMWVVFGVVRIAVPPKSMARDVQLGRRNEFMVHMKYERWERSLYLDGQMFYHVGDDPKKLTLTNGRYSEDFFVYMEGTVMDVWIDDVQYQLHRDAPPSVIHFSNRDHKFQINTESNQVVVDGHDICPAFGPPKQVQLAYVVHSIQFEPPSRRVLIDGNMCEVDLVSRFPVVIVGGKARGVRFQGPPRKIIINKYVYEVPMDRPLRARIFGNRPQLLAFGGPGHEVIIDDKWFEVKYGDTPKQIRVGARHCKIELPGPPPEVKILGEYVPVEQILSRTSQVAGPPIGPEGPGPHMQGPPQRLGSQPINPGMLGPPTFGPPGPNMGHLAVFQGGPNPGQLPNVRPAPALDMNSLLFKLKSAGIIGSNPGSNRATPPPSEANGDEIEQEMVLRESVEEIPDLTAFKTDFLKKRYDGARQLLSVGIQCASCGLRFVPEHKVQYKEHLDWHFRQNKRGKDDMKVAKHRHWYYSLSDWIQYEEISDLEQRAQSSFFEQSLQVSQQPGGRSLPGQGDFISCPAVSGEEDDGVCGICEEPFEQFWDEDEEEWHLKDAIRAKNGKTYHPVCYEDVKESNMSLMETPGSADLMSKKPQFSPLPAPDELQPTPVKPESVAKSPAVTVTSMSATASPARDVDEYVPSQLMDMINNPLGYLTSLSKQMKKSASSSALTGMESSSPATAVTTTVSAPGQASSVTSTAPISVTPKESIPSASLPPAVSSSNIPPTSEPVVRPSQTVVSVNLSVQCPTQPLNQSPLREVPQHPSPLAHIQTLTYPTATHSPPPAQDLGLPPSGGGTPVRDEPDLGSGGGTPLRDEPGIESGRGTPVEDEPRDPSTDHYGQGGMNPTGASLLHVIAPITQGSQGSIMTVIKQEPSPS